MKIGLIGYGRLGKMIHHYLGEDCQLLITDPYSKEVPKAQMADLVQLSTCSMIIIAVPISQFEKTVIELSKVLNDQTSLIIDVCSVKTIPMEIMKKHLPTSVSILGTHPMFGPDSAKDTLFGKKIVLTPERINESLYRNITLYLQNHGIKVVEATAKEHDSQIATGLNLSHLIGRTMLDMQVTKLEIDTLGHRRLMKILKTVENDSWQLFCDMNNYNPYAKDIRDKFKKSLEKVLSALE